VSTAAAYGIIANQKRESGAERGGGAIPREEWEEQQSERRGQRPQQGAELVDNTCMHRGLDFVCFLSYPTILNEDETAVRFRLETFSATQHHVFKTKSGLYVCLPV